MLPAPTDQHGLTIALDLRSESWQAKTGDASKPVGVCTCVSLGSTRCSPARGGAEPPPKLEVRLEPSTPLLGPPKVLDSNPSAAGAAC